MADKLTKKQEKILGEMYPELEAMIDDLQALGPVSREFSLVLTKLEEAEMWCERGFEAMGYEPPSDEEEDEDEEETEEEEESQ
jgi:hypothetical protein